MCGGCGWAGMSTDSSSKSHAARARDRSARFAVSLTASLPRMPARSSRRSTYPRSMPRRTR